jgi:hypothetical protein
MPSPLCIRYAYRHLGPDGTLTSPTRKTTKGIAEVAASFDGETDSASILAGGLYLGNDSDEHVDSRFAFVRVEIHEVTPEEMDEIGAARR